MEGFFNLLQGDCREVMAGMEPNSVDSIVTDPPYGLRFMGKDWDHGVPGEHFWAEALRVAKPGAHLLAFGGTRTFHRLAVAIEDAGWEIRDTVMWVYGSGFPKSLDVSKAIDKAAGLEREVVGRRLSQGGRSGGTSSVGQHLIDAGREVEITAPATEAARQWQGWGTALKPAWEPVIVARKPLEGTVAGNVLKWGTGAVNIDGCRVSADEGRPSRIGDYKQTDNNAYQGRMDGSLQGGSKAAGETTQGRWPANLIHDGSDEVLGVFPVTGPSKAAARGGSNPNPMDWGNGRADGHIVKGHNDNGGSAARFFYCAKTSKKDRDEGLDGFAPRKTTFAEGTGLRNNGDGSQRNQEPSNRNHHPTVKPTALMRYLCRLVTPPGGIVLDPFMGSGSTGKAVALEGFRFIGIELNEEYMEIARARIEHGSKQ
jgi:DNA modification methylase